jgi:ribosomal protein L11 methyltransferase
MNLSPYDHLYIYYLEGRMSRPWETELSRFVGNWEEDGYTFLFFTAPATEQVNILLEREPDLTLLDEFKMTYEEWQGGKLQPLLIGQFLILPPWYQTKNQAPPISHGHMIVLDPGVVFGNGLHPTTRDCLEALEMAFRRRRVETVLDMGTGTGLLALAAGKLGCRKCLALDFNHLAARTALANVRQNGLENTILVYRGRAEEYIDTPGDLLVANIHFDVMGRLVRSEGFLSKKAFILSGLLRSEAKKIEDDLSRLPVDIIQRWGQDNIWHTFYGETRMETPWTTP